MKRITVKRYVYRKHGKTIKVPQHQRTVSRHMDISEREPRISIYGKRFYEKWYPEQDIVKTTPWEDSLGYPIRGEHLGYLHVPTKAESNKQYPKENSRYARDDRGKKVIIPIDNHLSQKIRRLAKEQARYFQNFPAYDLLDTLPEGRKVQRRRAHMNIDNIGLEYKFSQPANAWVMRSVYDEPIKKTNPDATDAYLNTFNINTSKRLNPIRRADRR